MERLFTRRPAVELSSRKYPTIAPPLCFWYFPGVSISNSYSPLRIVLISLCISNRLLLHRQLVKSMIFIKILQRISYSIPTILWVSLWNYASKFLFYPPSSAFPDSAHPPTLFYISFLRNAKYHESNLGEAFLSLVLPRALAPAWFPQWLLCCRQPGIKDKSLLWLKLLFW